MTRRIWRRGLALALIAAMLLAGCDALGFQSEPVVLRMMAPPGDAKGLQDALEAYQRDHHNVTVEVVTFSPWPYIMGELRDAIANEELDILRNLNTPLGDEGWLFMQAGLVQPLDGRLGKEWDAFREDSFPGAWDALSYAGQQMGVPSALDPIVVYATAEVADALGVDLDATWNTTGDPAAPVPWTTDDLAATAELLHQPKGLAGLPPLRIEGLCADMYQDPGPLALIALRGGSLMDDLAMPSHPTLDDPATVEAASWYAGLFAEDAVGDPPRIQQAFFRNGGLPEAAGTCSCGLWFGRFGDRGGIGSRFPWECGSRMLPLPADDEPTGMAFVEGYYVARSCAHPEEALELIRYLTKQTSAAGARIPARLSLARDESYLQTLPDDIARTVRAYTQEGGLYWGRTTLIPLSAGQYLLSMPGMPSLMSSLHQAIDQIAREDVAPQVAMAAAQRQAEEALAP